MSGRSTRKSPDLNLLLFDGLRKEFILDRSSFEPFEPAPESTRVGPEFDFGLYLSHCHTHLLEEIVDIKPPALLFFAFGVVVYFGYFTLAGGNHDFLAWTWVFIGYFIWGFNIYFEVRTMMGLS